MSSRRTLAAALLLALAGGACTSGRPAAVRVDLHRATSPTTVTTEAPTTAAPTTTLLPTTVAGPALRRTPPPATTARPALRPAPAPAARAPLLVERLHGLGGATQAITVTSPSWGSSSATLQAFERDGGVWRTIVGPTPAFVGVNGFAQSKREGDGRSPVGIYGFGTMFGTDPDPGVRFPYRRAAAGDVWVDDSASSLYNTWQQDPAAGRWASAERLDQPRPYSHAAVIDYNTARQPGKGSAIFLHVSLGHGTAGCVAVAEPVLVSLLRWLDPARQSVIVMGPQSYVEQL